MNFISFTGGVLIAVLMVGAMFVEETDEAQDEGGMGFGM